MLFRPCRTGSAAPALTTTHNGRLRHVMAEAVCFGFSVRECVHASAHDISERCGSNFTTLVRVHGV